MSAPPMAMTRWMPTSAAITLASSSGHNGAPIATNSAAEHQARGHGREVQRVPAGQQQRLAADHALQLAERDDRAGEGHRADEHAEEHLDVVDQSVGPGELQCGIEVMAKPTSTAAAPTKLCRIATSCGIAVICTRAASAAPISPPIASMASSVP